MTTRALASFVSMLLATTAIGASIAANGCSDAHHEATSPDAGTHAHADGGASKADAHVLERDAYLLENDAGPSTLDAPVETVTFLTDAGCKGQFPIVANARDGSCAVTPSDIACDASANCVVEALQGCFGATRAYAVSMQVDAACDPFICKAPPPAFGGVGTGNGASVMSEDFAWVASLSEVGAKCVDHQCRSYAIQPP